MIVPSSISRLSRLSAVLVALTAAHLASAQENGATREAARHFQRGVALYGETDYRAALVEFKRAYALAPNAAVLYNVGEAEFQLQDYAGALTTFERYLTESSASDTHRAEVESSVEVLRARVGHLTIATTPPGADVTVDDQSVGRTPLERPVLVSIGHRKVVASLPGRPPSTRTVDVAADDNVTVAIQLAPPGEPLSTLAPRSPASTRDAEPSTGGATLRVLGWIGTGVLAAGAGTFAVLADRESIALQKARATYPISGATLAHDAGLTSTYSILADSLAGAAVVLGGITVFSTLQSHSPDARVRGSAGGARIGVGPASAHFEMTF
jgi:hypothetical protein